MTRRAAMLALLALAGAARAYGQPAKAPRIALVDPAEPTGELAEGRNPLWSALLAELRRLGHAEGRTVSIDRWSGRGVASEAANAALAQKVIAGEPRLIVVRGRNVLVAVAGATAKIPIVAVSTIPPELRVSLARPGKNVTGIHVSFDAQQLYGKQVEVLRDVVKPDARIGWLGTRIAWEGLIGEAARKGAQAAKVELWPVFVPNPVGRSTIRSAFAEIAQSRIDGLLISPALELFPYRTVIAELATAQKLPSLGNGRHWADAGTLIGYGNNFEEMGRRAAHYVDGILKGADPAVMPIQQPTSIELIVNLETAKSLGVAIPQALLLRADRVIE